MPYDSRNEYLRLTDGETYARWTKAKLTNKNPNYKALISRKVAATQQYTRTDTEWIKDIPFDVHILYKDIGPPSLPAWQPYGEYNGFPGLAVQINGFPTYVVPPANSTIASSVIQVANSFHDKQLKEKTQVVASGAFAGEYVQDGHRMISSRAKSLYAAIRHFLTTCQNLYRTIRNPARAIKAISDLYLEKVFGWDPMIGDIAKASKHFLNPRRSEMFFARGSGKDSSVIQSGFQGGILPGVSYRSRLVVKTTTRYKRVSAFSRSLRAEQGPDIDSEDWGLTLRDFVPTLWELLPFSFLVDYFLNVQEVLESAMTSRAGMVYQYANTLNTVEYSRLWELSDLYRVTGTRSLATDIGTTNGIVSYKSYYFSRVVPTAEQNEIALSTRVPAYDSLKWLNIGALVASNSIKTSKL